MVAAIFAALYARQAADVGRKTYKAFTDVERANLKVSISGTSYSNTKLSAGITATNIGKSPALVTLLACEWQQTSRFDEIGAYLSQSRHDLVDASKPQFLGWVERKTPAHRFLRGLVRYTSPFDEHVTHFCFEAIPQNGGAQPTIYFRDIKGGDWPQDT